MEEKDLKKVIEEQSEKVQIPVTLEPDCVMEQLKESAKKRKLAYYRKFMAAAACCVVVAGVGAAGAGLFDGQGKNGKEGTTANADSSPESSEDTSASGGEGGGNKVTAIASAKDYEEVYSYIEAEQERMKKMRSNMTMEKKSETAVADSAASEAELGNGVSAYAGSAYSDTNIREEGVGEGDIVKTDGKRIYTLNNHTINIVDIEGEMLEELGEIVLAEDSYVAEIFVKNDRLTATYSKSEYTEPADGSEYGMYRSYTVAETFDVSNPAEPESMGTISQSGDFHTMRVVGDYVYLLSNYYPEMEAIARDIDTYIPMVQGNALESKDILLPSVKAGSQYTVITAFSLENPGEQTDSKAVFGTTGMCYVSGQNIYICENDYDAGNSEDTVTRTWIRKIGYQDGKFNAVGQVKIDGTLNDSFSIDEHNGNLRLVTTLSPVINHGVMPISLFRSAEEEEAEEEAKKDTNTLYILDENLQELSRIEGLAEDEQVYSARFMGDTGYFVTYKQIDPLFSVDLSDPKNPQILGELKIPGFSEYLHPFGEGKLLGIGMDTDESGMTTNGVKLSMFDISNPTDVQEIQKYVIEKTYSTDVAYNYKAAFVDVEKSLIGFAAYGDLQKYYIFSYGEEGFTSVFERELTGMSTNVRAFYAGEKLYLVAGNTIESYELATFEKIDDIVL